MRRRLVLLGTLGALFASVAMPLPVAAANPVIRGVVVQSGLQIPWDVAFAPGGQMFVTERPGRVRVFASSAPNAALLASTTIPDVWAVGEAGVMGIEVDHLFNSNRLIYVCVSRLESGQPRNRVIRYKVLSNWRLQHDRYITRTPMLAAGNHDGCAVEEGPDLNIWITMGDATNAALAQNPNSLNGKVLRARRDGSVPPENPIMPGASGRSYVLSMGHRNPQGITFQPGTNRVYISEHGPERSDEINWVLKGRNYGWPCRVGFTAYQSCGNPGPFQNPVWQSGASTIATSGATFVSGANWQDFAGHLFISQLKEQDLRRFTIASAGSPATYRQTHFNNTWGRLRAATLGPGNLLYITTSNGTNDLVIRIIPSPT